jgi:hypothetical protein
VWKERKASGKIGGGCFVEPCEDLDCELVKE